ncbi:MAG: (Fe-S)-binding protein [Sandaracinaceae bacterium]|nr:(Fe-S)-binding protein [Sandaracinaceae bacterium]MBK8408811.1 (Fe-S)-binding protein [Sandaracinaceae bacterium]MBP7681311.1 (Fe-S)-binding protein [Deltaproteobacteria bacterium]
MTHSLPLVAAHEREHTFCSFCPKLCRVACPVSTAQASETTTPWGKMTTLHHLAKGQLPLDEDHAASLYACTGCQRCKSYCDHDTEVADALNAGRAEAVRARVAPAAAYAVIEAHQARQERAKSAAEAIFGDKLTRTDAPIVFFPGCTACVRRPEDALAGEEAVRKLTGLGTRVEAAGCCGLPLLEAGDRDGFLSAATRTLARLEGAQEVVFEDPGCLYALSVSAKRMGLHSDVRMTHLTQLADRHLARIEPIADLPDGPVRYHDPCKLGRGLGVYEEPRRVLRKVLGRQLSEFHHSGERAECSGGGGQLPRTDRPTSDAIAKERLRTHAREGGGLLVSACAGSAQRFEAQPDAPQVASFASLLVRAIRD